MANFEKLPSVLLLSMMSDGMAYPFGQFGPTVLAVSLPNLLPTLRLLIVGAGQHEKQKRPWQCVNSVQQ